MKIICSLAVLFVIVLLYTLAVSLTLFEDGSWAVGSFPYPISGCLPWAICSANALVILSRK